LDSDGWPIAEALPMFGPLLVSWVRCVDWLGEKQLPVETLEILRSAVRQLLRLVKPDGRMMFAEPGGRGHSAAADPSALRLLCRFSDDSANRKFSRLGASHIVGTKAGQAAQKKQLKQCLKGKWPTLRSSADRKKEMRDAGLASGNVSEFGESGILRASWDWHASSVGIRFDGGKFAMEMTRFVSLIAGNCQPVIQFNGQPIRSLGASELLCEYHDEDVDYLEIQVPLESEVNLVRQILLCHREDVVLIADAVSGPSAGDWDYCCDWPLAEGVATMAETETREIYLMSENSIHALLLPVSLPEWQQGPTTGKLRIAKGKVELTDRQKGAGLYVPLVVDLCPRRSRLKRTWRHLTVAESKQVVGRDIAAAYRFQLDKQQWFFYRAIGRKGNRSFLGENFTGEFLFARFGRDGGVTEMIRIE
jgi:hypothetical protein